MIFIVGFFCIAVLTVISVIRSKKPLKQILIEAKYELIYNYMGSKALLEDMYMSSSNRIEITPKPGKVALITGGTRGIGLEVVRMLLQCDIFVIVGCRNVQFGNTLLDIFRKQGILLGNIVVHPLDISSMESIKKFGSIVQAQYPKINYLINNGSYTTARYTFTGFNAGIMFGPHIETRDGFESQFSTNYLGHFLLTHLVLPSVKCAGKADENARIINVTSCAHVVGRINFEDINSLNRYIPAEAYAQSKLAQVLFTNFLNNLLAKEGQCVQVHAVHPGLVNTDLFNDSHLKKYAPWIPKLLFKSPAQGAIPVVYACLSNELEGKGGTYIHNCRIYDTSQHAKSAELQEKLFTFTNDLIGIKKFGQSEIRV